MTPGCPMVSLVVIGLMKLMPLIIINDDTSKQCN